MPAKYSPEKFAEVFWSHVDQSADCWPWTGTVARDGYGKTSTGRPAHRVAYELAFGPIPEGLEIDHVLERGCTRRDCVRPAHLEAVTASENQRRRFALLTHCKNGHGFTPENTYFRASGGNRVCRACNRAAVQRYKARRRAA